MNIKGRELDVFVLALFLAFAILYAYLTKDLLIGKSAVSGFIGTAPPIIYLGFRRKKNWPKILVATLIFGTMFGFVFEFLMEYSKAYSVVSTVTNFKFLGVLPPANVVGHTMMAMLTFVFYEHFVDRETDSHISKNLKYALLPASFAIIYVLILFFFDRSSIPLSHSRYPYLTAGIAAILPALYLGIKSPKFIKNMVLTGTYFFFFYLISEIVAVDLKYWVYNGNNYIGWVTISNIKFPFEELFFWMFFYAACLVSYYELFIDKHSSVPHPHVK